MSGNNLKKMIPVLVTGVGGGGHGHEIVKALRLAGRYWIVGVDMSENSIGFFDVDEAFIIPPATAPEYLQVLLDLATQKNIRVLFHGSEPELRIISQERDKFARKGILVPINSSRIIEMGMNKWATMTFLTNAGFLIPATTLVQTEDEIPVDFPFPAVVKPAVGGGGSNDTFLVQDTDELIFACRSLLRQGREPILQEYIGTPEDEYTVSVLHTLDGELLGSLALRRYIISGLSNRIKVANRSGRPEFSPILAVSSGISQGIIDDFPEVRRSCEAIAGALDSRGPLNIQCRFVHGRLYPFEINPRFSGTTFMRALMGFNEPDLLIRHHLLQECIPKPVKYRFGQVVRGLREQVVSGSVNKKMSGGNLGR